MSTAGVVRPLATAVALRAPLSQVSRVAGDPEYSSDKMMGHDNSDPGTMQVRFFTKGVVKAVAPAKQRQAFAGGDSEFNGKADIVEKTNIFGTRTTTYENGLANLISPDGNNVLKVKFTGTEKNIAPNVDEFKLEGKVTGGDGLFRGLKPGGHFACEGAFYRNDSEVGLGFMIEFS